MKLRVYRMLPAFLALMLAMTPLAARADNCILYWNQQALDATRLARNAPPQAALYLATFHVAIFDAVNGISGTHQGWCVTEAAPAQADKEAAVASAAYTVMTQLWTWTNPRTVKLAYESALSGVPEGRAKQEGIEWGRKVAMAVIAKRANSGYDKPIPGAYTSSEPGKWRETPAAFRPPLLPFWGKVQPFVMTSPSQFRAPVPPSLGSKQYAEELAYVAAHGCRDNADRTDYQTLCTPFWSDDLGTATPPGHWNVVAQIVARKRALSIDDAARLFALLNLAEADTGIAVWDTKYFYNTWRPETALRELDTKTNPAFTPHPEFIPNMASPSFPAYVSGHSAFSAAAARMLALFIGTDDFEFSIDSDGLPGVVHSFKKFSEAQTEVGMSRIWGGIHTMADNVEGQKMGMSISDWVFSQALKAR